MTYATLMVNLELGQSNAALLQLTGGLAERCGAAVIGIAARQPIATIYGDTAYIAPEVIQEERDETDKEMRDAEAEFQALILGNRKHMWRSDVSFERPSDYVTREARRADLVLTSRPLRTLSDATRVSTAELVMQAGRPVLVVPPASTDLELRHVLVAWKDTRETRRAVWDALPLLKLAGMVSIVEVAAEPDLPAARSHVADVVAWLERHDIACTGEAAPATGDNAEQLSAIAVEKGADLIVAGAYGHSRVREWALGGVTRDLLLRATLCTLLSH